VSLCRAVHHGFSPPEPEGPTGLEKEVINLASKEDFTVYDASYIYTAMRNGLTLVTEQRLKIKHRNT